MLKRIAMLGLSAILACSIFVGCGKKDETDSLKRIQENGKFVVGLDDAFPPMGYRDANGDIVGFDIDLAKAVATKMGLEVEFKPIVWDNIGQEINSRNVDVIWNGCTITPEREKTFDFSNPYMYNKQCIVVREDSEIQTFDDLEGKTAAIQDGSTSHDALDAKPEVKDKLANIVGYADNSRALQDLAAGGVDCVVVDGTVFAYYNSLQPNTFRRLEPALSDDFKFGVAFHKGDDTFREAMQKALDECEAEGITSELSEKWLYSDETKQ